MNSIKILALDLSLSTGWCITTITNEPTYISGKWKLKNTDPITRTVDLYNKLRELNDHEELNLIVFERVDFSKFVMAHSSYNQLLAALYLFVELTGIPIYGVPVKVLKKVSTGNGNANKDLMVKEANKLWPDKHYDLKDNDEVDALLLAKYTCDSLSDPMASEIFKAKYDIRKSASTKLNKTKVKVNSNPMLDT